MVGSVLGPKDFPRFILASVAESSRESGKNTVIVRNEDQLYYSYLL
jgi:hypothetical protein